MLGVCSRVIRARRKPTPHRFFVAAGVLAAALSSAAAGQSAPAGELTEREAIRRGLERSALREILEGQEAAARSEAVQAALWPNPTVAYAREQTPGNLPGSREDYAWLTQRFDLSGRRALHVGAAEKRVRAATAAGAARQQDVAAEIRVRFFAVLHAERRLAALERWASDVVAADAVVAKREAAGDVAGYDRQRVAREAAGAEARRRAEAATLALLRERLAAVTGVNPPDFGGGVRVAGNLLPESAPSPVETLLDAVVIRPDLQALAARSAAAEDEIRAAARWWVPEVLLGGGVKSVEADGERSTGFTALGEVPLPLFDRGQAARAQAQAELRVARGELDLKRAEAVADVRGLYAQATELAAAARAARSSAVDTRRLGDTAVAGYRGGELGILELLDAHRSVLDAELQALDLEWDARLARIELDRVAGGGVP